MVVHGTGNIDQQGEFVLADRTEDELAAFEHELDHASMMGEWQVPRKPEPDPGGVPHLWKWGMVYDKMLKASDVLSLEMGARRSLLFINPAELPNRGSILGVRVGLQMMNASEIAFPHRHTMAAIRFVLKGSAHTYTVVNDQKLYMEDWSLILTPPQMWHHHENHGSDKVIWLDAIDTPFVNSVNALFYEPYPDDREPIVGRDSAEVNARVGWVRPSWEPAPEGDLPIVYRWGDTERALKALAGTPGSLYDGILLKYVNPLTGGPVLPTFSCSVQMLRPGEKTRSHRHTFGAVYHVLRGHGSTQAGDMTLDWEAGAGDSFVVPNWAWHAHRNLNPDQDALLFVVDDEPVLTAARLTREESG
ncbi:MAG: Cupin protein [Chloroflexi bacterium]|nr:Cupin protein [Chloroflexota bacterium]